MSSRSSSISSVGENDENVPATLINDAPMTVGSPAWEAQHNNDGNAAMVPFTYDWRGPGVLGTPILPCCTMSERFPDQSFRVSYFPEPYPQPFPTAPVLRKCIQHPAVPF